MAKTLSLEPRSLAVFRILIACLLLADQWLAASNLRAFYTDSGVLPRHAMLEHTHRTSQYWSLYLGFDSPLLICGLLIIAVISAVASLLGYRTRLATVLCWVMLVSLQGRNGLVLSGGDSVMRMMLLEHFPAAGCMLVSGCRETQSREWRVEDPTRAARGLDRRSFADHVHL